MPRIYTSASDPIDFCRKCFPKTEKAARSKYGGGDTGPDDRGDCFSYNDDHPSYRDSDYRCHVCRVVLTEKDHT